MTHKMLVPLDHSAFSRHIFAEALIYAKALHSEMLLLHVLSSGESGSPTPPMMPLMPFPEYYPGVSTSALEIFEQAWKDYEEKGLTILKQYLENVEASGLNADIRQVHGAPGQTICQTAQEWNASLILMGRRGHTGLSELLIGSVSNYVLHHAPCSVLVVNQQDQSE